MNLYKQYHSLLRQAGIANRISDSAYDTAWVVQLGEYDSQLAERGIQWLSEHRLPDGGWGAKELVYGHDRFICTLAAMIALAKQGWDKNSLRASQEALEKYTKCVLLDPAGATVGFEMIAPTMVAEAQEMNLVSRSDNALLRGLKRVRSAKLESLSGHKITRFVTPAFSAEMVGSRIELLDENCLQDANGSVACSPAATAFFALKVKPQDAAALDYLRRISNNGTGGIPYVYPLEIFEHAWILWNLALTGLDDLDHETISLCQPSLDIMEKNWSPKYGIPTVLGLGFPDSDASSITFDVLNLYGRDAPISGLLHYEEKDHFRCYALESDPSTSTNIHVLHALQTAGFGKDHPTVQKVMSFLRRTRTGRLFWFDKWHSSPYYPTSHAAIVMLNYEREMALDALYWIRETQNEDGSWGFYNVPTAEETAYALQALATWKQHGGDISTDILKRGFDWLVAHVDPPYPSLWTGKSLYCPVLVVQSAILSALILIKDQGNN
jgi:halimadienyl-diphosphate synthase